MQTLLTLLAIFGSAAVILWAYSPRMTLHFYRARLGCFFALPWFVSAFGLLACVVNVLAERSKPFDDQDWDVAGGGTSGVLMGSAVIALLFLLVGYFWSKKRLNPEMDRARMAVLAALACDRTDGHLLVG
jgi:hypothetical protein